MKIDLNEKRMHEEEMGEENRGIEGEINDMNEIIVGCEKSILGSKLMPRKKKN